MSSPVPPRRVPPLRVPTLTEVIVWPVGAPTAPAASGSAPVSAQGLAAEAVPLPMPAADMAAPASTVTSTITEDQWVQHVLAGVQRQVDLALEYRLRETLTPLLTRAADGIVREARAELSASLRELVARAVAQELGRHRPR